MVSQYAHSALSTQECNNVFANTLSDFLLGETYSSEAYRSCLALTYCLRSRPMIVAHAPLVGSSLHLRNINFVEISNWDTGVLRYDNELLSSRKARVI